MDITTVDRRDLHVRDRRSDAPAVRMPTVDALVLTSCAARLRRVAGSTNHIADHAALHEVAHLLVDLANRANVTDA